MELYLKNESMNWGDFLNANSDVIIFVRSFIVLCNFDFWTPGSTANVLAFKNTVEKFICIQFSFCYEANLCYKKVTIKHPL